MLCGYELLGVAIGGDVELAYSVLDQVVELCQHAEGVAHQEVVDVVPAAKGELHLIGLCCARILLPCGEEEKA